jgi:hypothetical protein
MTDYPNADSSLGYVYDPDSGGVAYNNARSTGSFTISTEDTTTVIDTEVQVGDIVIITAANQKAATMIAGGADVTASIYVSAVVPDSFTVTHDNSNAALGSIFYYAVFPSF